MIFPNTQGWSISYAIAGFFAVVREAEWQNLRESWAAAYDHARTESDQWRERARKAEAIR